MQIDSKIKLNNGVMMPYFGLGTYRIPDEVTKDAVFWALETGYRLVDTASMYRNEWGVGKTVRASGIPRKEIFITTKINNPEHDDPKAALNYSLEALATDYVDLYLIHWPVPERLRTWKAMEGFLEDGKCKAIGVSNFTIKHLDELLAVSEVTPAVNQVEFSPFLYQKDLLEYCKSKGIALEAYSPLTEGELLGDETLVKVGESYGKSTAQILIRWALQHELIVIPGSKSKEHIEENANVFDFEINKADMKVLDSLNRDYRTCWDPTDIT